MRQCLQELTRWTKASGAEVRIDAAGNFRALYSASEPNAPRLLIGSHLDTVPNAGAYDGVLGVVLAGALIEELRGRKLPFAIEILGFSEEEGVRFGRPFIGSRALVGRLDEELLNVRDDQGISVRDAIENFGLDPDEIPSAALDNDTLGYLEFHIEQGPVLENLSLTLAAVDAIAGQSRLELIFTGRANHAGTTPMDLRRDALAAAAEWIGIVEEIARATPGLVATVGKLDVKPRATNVIPGETRATLDVRHPSDEMRTLTVKKLIDLAHEVAARRQVILHEETLLNQRAVAMDTFLVEEIEKAIAAVGCQPYRMTSGAGHDAMILAERVPSAMIFLRSPGGISHDPAEAVLREDVEKAIDCGLHLLDRLVSSSEFLRRKKRA